MINGAAGHRSSPAEFVGRSAELEEVIRGLVRYRTVWITGCAGAGRTRFASEVGRRVTGAFPDGVLHLALTDAEDERSTTPSELIRRLNRIAGPESPAADDLGRAFSSSRHLLVLDDADGVALEPILEVLRIAPDCAAVITTVRPPATDAGLVVALGPFPTVEHDVPLQQALQNPGVQLFADVAARADPGFVLDAASVPFVASICRSVNGLPLAIELAAGRVRTFGAGTLAERLAQGSAAGLLSRGEISVHGALARTCRQLPAEAQLTLRRLGVFPDQFSLAAAVAVCGLPESDLVDHLVQLVDLGLVQQLGAVTARDFDRIRFALSPLVRQFARDELRVSGEDFEVSQLHADYHAHLARHCVLQLDDAHDVGPRLRLNQAYPDLGLAASWLSSQGRPVEALRVAVDRAAVAGHLDDPIEVGRSLGRLLEQAEPAGVPTELRADALLRLAELRFISIENVDALHSARRILAEGTELARQRGQPLLLIRALRVLAVALPVTGDFAATAAALQEGRELAERLGHVRWLARFEALTGMMYHQQRDFGPAVEYGVSALHRALRAGDGRALISAGALLHHLPPEVLPDLPLLPEPAELLVIAQQLDDPEAELMVVASLSSRAIARGDATEAAYWACTRLELMPAGTGWRGAGFVLLSLTHIAYLVDDPESAAWFHGIIASRLPLLLAGMPPTAAAAYERLVGAIRAAVGQDRFNRQVSRGSLLTWPEALHRAHDYAERIATKPEPPPQAVVDKPGSVIDGGIAARLPTRSEDELSPRERQILALMAHGRTNKEIGSALGISPKTVMHHSGSIYRKLGVRGRAEAAAAAVRDRMLEH